MYDPPEEGIAVPNSDLEKAPGNTTVAAKIYASQNADALLPMLSAARAGRRNIPDPSIEERLIVTTPKSPICLLREEDSMVSTFIEKKMIDNNYLQCFFFLWDLKLIMVLSIYNILPINSCE